MSNLNLPKMTFDNLSDLVGDKWRVPLAYATHAERVADATIYVKHHESVIAVIEPDSVWITNAGYESSTTTNRLSHILRDNGIPFSVRIKQYRNIIEDHASRTARPFVDAMFVKQATGWTFA